MWFEQTEVNSEIWLPKRLLLTGSGRVGLVKRLAQDVEIEWSNYKKFSVDSRLVTTPAPPKN
jgi:6-phosphogluconolactonase/glucosamine-6-phosphate isomerase/deaminase